MPINVAGVMITVTIDGLDEQQTRLRPDNLDALAALSRVVRKWTHAAQKQAVENVSGRQVIYSGGTFVINRQTGKLARSIGETYPSPYHGIVRAGANYAAAIEEGVDHPVDLKPALMGKTVFIPFKTPFGNRSSPIAYPVQTSSKGGNNPQNPDETRAKVTSVPLYSSKGSRIGNKFGIFRRIGPNTQGFIIPPRKAKPFMLAAAEAIEPQFQNEALEAVKAAMRGSP